MLYYTQVQGGAESVFLVSSSCKYSTIVVLSIEGISNTENQPREFNLERLESQLRMRNDEPPVL